MDAIQFRMHDESGLKPSEQEGFWRDVFQMMHEAAPKLRLDLRAKGLPDSVIQSAIGRRRAVPHHDQVLDGADGPAVSSDAHQPGEPIRPPPQLRGPAALTRNATRCTGGSGMAARRACSVWGDPDYARRFAESTRLYDGDGFEVNEPLCTKMEAQPHDAQPFDLLTPAHRYYDYEFERYWHFFQVFGRVGYNTEHAPGSLAARIREALRPRSGALRRARRCTGQAGSCRASSPRAIPYSAFPMTRGWAEKQRLGDLPAYAKAEGSDIQQFASFDDEARMLLEGDETAKTLPRETSRWFAQTAADISAQIAEAGKRIGSHRNREFDSTITDLNILANLALFHARVAFPPPSATACLHEPGIPRRLTTQSPPSAVPSKPGGSLWPRRAISMPKTL